jgi:TRAP-type C4-dicarboxylate transport system permease small subunit
MSLESQPESPAAAAPSLLDKVDKVAVAIAGTALVGVAAVEAWQVFARYVMNSSPSWTESIALLLMSTTLMLGAAALVRREAHFGFFIAADALPQRLRTALRLAVRVLIATLGALLAVRGLQLAVDSWPVPTAGVPLPQGAAFLPVFVGGTLIAVFAIERLLRAQPKSAANE